MKFETEPPWDILWTNAHLATMAAGADAPYGAIREGALAIREGRIAWLGPAADLPLEPAARARERRDAGGRWLLPALIDCHTHLVYAGDRSAEFEARLAGASYQEIAAAGGGILSTLRATRAASVDALVEQSAPRALALKAEGVRTAEIKSGYGLDLENELKMLRAARKLEAETGLRVVTTLLAAHALPPEYAEDRNGYIDLICSRIIPAAAETGLADAVDAYCETIAFSADDCARVFEAAEKHGLPVKLHADQFSDSGGAALAARAHALSADHLEYSSADGVAAMAAAGTVATILPGAFYFLRETKKPPIEALRAAGVPMAVATDCNPGSSPCASLRLAMNMACTLFGMTAEEALAGVTREAARALGLADEIGALEVGKRAEIVAFDIESPAALCYWMGGLEEGRAL
ncbi:MAG: imidazolonepropionase [Parvularculaceae bacterium]